MPGMVIGTFTFLRGSVGKINFSSATGLPEHSTRNRPKIRI